MNFSFSSTCTNFLKEPAAGAPANGALETNVAILMAVENGKGNGDHQLKLKVVLSVDRRLKQRRHTSPFIFAHEDLPTPDHLIKAQIDQAFG